MRLVCSTLGFEAYPLEEALEHLAVIGCEAVEVVLDEPANPLELLDWRSLGRLQACLDGWRLRVALLDGWHERHSQDGDEWLRRARATVDAAYGVGAPVAEIHLAGMRPAELDAKLPKLLSHAERRGVRLAVELPARVPLPLQRWLKATDPGLVGVTVDLEGAEGDWREPVEGWGDRLWSMRVPLGSGVGDLGPRVASLRASGFDGVLCLKSAGPEPSPHRQAREALRGLRPLFEALRAGD